MNPTPTTLKAEAREEFKKTMAYKRLDSIAEEIDAEFFLDVLIDRVHNAALDLAGENLPSEMDFSPNGFMHEYVKGNNSCRAATLQALKKLRV